MKYALCFACLIATGFANQDEEVALVIKNEEKVSLSYFDALKGQIKSLQNQIRILQTRIDGIQTKTPQDDLKAQIDELSSRMDLLSQHQIATQEIAMCTRRKSEPPEPVQPPTPPPAPATIREFCLPYLSPARAEAVCGWNFFLTAEYLLWQPSEANLAYARSTGNWGNELTTTLESAAADKNTIRIYNVDFGWDSGFRVQLGYNMGHDSWDTLLSWTWLYSSTNDSVSSSPPNFFFALNAMSPYVSEEGAEAPSISSHFQLHLNLCDWELGRDFFLSKWLTVRPFASLRTGWVNQNWKTHLQGEPGLNIAALGGFIDKYDIYIKQDFWGIGPRVGLDTEWGLISGLGFFADGALSLLYGFFEDKRRDVAVLLTPPIPPSGPEIVHPFARNITSEQTIAELQLGLRWDQPLYCDRYHLRLQAGWEHTVFFDHNRIFYINGESQDNTFVSQTKNLMEYGGNLGFQGVSLSGRFDF